MTPKKLILTLRVPEVVFMSSFFMAAILFLPCETINPFTLVLVYCYVLLYIQGVYALNSFADYNADLHNPRLKSVSNVKKPTYVGLTILFLSTSLLLGVWVKQFMAVLLLIGFLHWVLYYLPPFQLKRRTVWGTALHFTGGIVHYYLCHLAFGELDSVSIYTSTYIALLLSIGHLNHEALDYESDKKVMITNTTTKYGLMFNRILMTLIASAALSVLFAGYISKNIFAIQFYILLIPTLTIIPGIFFWAKSPRLLQSFYRWSFALSGIVLIIFKIYVCGFSSNINL